MNIYEELEAINFANYEEFDNYNNYVKDITRIFDRYDHKTLFELCTQIMGELLDAERYYEIWGYRDSADEYFRRYRVLKEYLLENISNKKVESELSHYI
ncbi:hypothetical protein WJ968_32925 [Achromobacter xylosoxidans]|uniref:hypothetical protein n=1 Tax=Alcaligenes xylosoxydans xylosoxydans TaxID=85698 RepID=UPI0006C58257|nr:hypothetical protein [Achromobacter xylosoxidans]CUJ71683.1 Uncharacterised protein [Achromobacter xylosoxidans]